MTLPDHVRHLKPVEVIEPEPTNAQLMTVLIEIQTELASLSGRITAMETDISTTKTAVCLVYEQVQPTLEMLTNGPIGQLLGIAPPPERRPRRGRL